MAKPKREAAWPGGDTTIRQGIRAKLSKGSSDNLYNLSIEVSSPHDDTHMLEGEPSKQDLSSIAIQLWGIGVQERTAEL